MYRYSMSQVNFGVVTITQANLDGRLGAHRTIRVSNHDISITEVDDRGIEKLVASIDLARLSTDRTTD